MLKGAKQAEISRHTTDHRCELDDKVVNSVKEGEEEEGDEVERKSEIMEKAYVKTAEEVLGYKKKKNMPRLSQEAWTLIDQRKAIKQKLIGARSERQKKRSLTS